MVDRFRDQQFPKKIVSFFEEGVKTKNERSLLESVKVSEAISLLDVVERLHESRAVASGVEFLIVRFARIELLHIDQAIVRYDRLTPNTTDIVLTRRDQQIRHGTSAKNRITVQYSTSFSIKNVREA